MSSSRMGMSRMSSRMGMSSRMRMGGMGSMGRMGMCRVGMGGSVEQVWEELKESIVACTGLSPPVFFTVFALAIAFFYYVFSGFVDSQSDADPSSRKGEEEAERLPPPVQMGEVTEEELKAYDGSDPKKPLLMAIKGQIYDVSQSRMFYGPGGPYEQFTGKDASRALAKMSFEENDLTGDISGLGPFELDVLHDWEYKFMRKYVKVGTIKKNTPVVDDSPSSGAGKPTENTGESAHSRDVGIEST